jgi:hypothetical protein
MFGVNILKMIESVLGKPQTNGALYRINISQTKNCLSKGKVEWIIRNICPQFGQK